MRIADCGGTADCGGIADCRGGRDRCCDVDGGRHELAVAQQLEAFERKRRERGEAAKHANEQECARVGPQNEALFGETNDDPEKDAGRKLTLAKRLIEDGMVEGARDALEEIIKKYKETKAAEEAKKNGQ